MATYLDSFTIGFYTASAYNNYQPSIWFYVDIGINDDGSLFFRQNDIGNNRDIGYPSGSEGRILVRLVGAPSLACFELLQGKKINFQQTVWFTGDGEKTFPVELDVDSLIGYAGVTSIEPAYYLTCETPVCYTYQYVYTRGASGLEIISGCDKMPDGQAAITLLVKRIGDGQILAIQRNFDFMVSDHSINFFDSWNDNPFGAWGDFIIYGYRIKSASGFTSGSVQVLETWSYAPGAQVQAFSIDRGNIQVGKGDVDGFLRVEQWSRSTVLDLGIPKYFDGKISLACNFAEPECVDDVYSGPPSEDEVFIQNNDFSTTINETIEIHITDGEGLTEELTKIDEPVEPPEPPVEQNCDCQVYQAKLIYEGLCYLQKTIDIRMSQILVAVNANQKELIKALVDGLKPMLTTEEIPRGISDVIVDGLKPLVTTEQVPRGIADVIAEKELDPIFLVDTNECFYKKTMPPDGDAWIGDMP